jgi:hypothetical protein
MGTEEGEDYDVALQHGSDLLDPIVARPNGFLVPKYAGRTKSCDQRTVETTRGHLGTDRR